MEKLTRTAYQTGPNLYATKLEAKNAIHIRFLRLERTNSHPSSCWYEVALTSAITSVNDGN